MPTITIHARTEDGTRGRVLYEGDHDNDAAALTHCAAAGVDLTRADLGGRTLDGANVSGLWAPKCDLRDASCLGWIADRVVDGRQLELSGALLQGANIEGDLSEANLACTQPTALRAKVGPNTNLRGCDWSQCPDVLELPVDKAEINVVGRVVAVRSKDEWFVHAGKRGVLTEEEAKLQLATRAEYTQALAWLDSPETVERKEEIEQRSKVDDGAGEVKEAEVSTKLGRAR